MIRYWAVLVIFLMMIQAGCGSDENWRFLPESDEDITTIYVVSHGWHTGIVISADNMAPQLSFLGRYFSNAAYYEFGWGDERFYRAGEIKLQLAVGALLWPTDSVLHVVALPESPENYFAGSIIEKVTISRKAHEYLNTALYDSFQPGSNSRAMNMGTGLYDNSLFFKGRESYFFARTCNKWTANCLYRAGVPINQMLSVTASGLMARVKTALNKPGYEQ